MELRLAPPPSPGVEGDDASDQSGESQRNSAIEDGAAGELVDVDQHQEVEEETNVPYTGLPRLDDVDEDNEDFDGTSGDVSMTSGYLHIHRGLSADEVVSAALQGYKGQHRVDEDILDHFTTPEARAKANLLLADILGEETG